MSEGETLSNLSKQCELHELHYSSFNLYEQCTLQDEKIILGIQAATQALSQDNFPFSYFDLQLSQYEAETISQLDATKFNTLFNPSNLITLSSEVAEFIKSISPERKNDDVANQVAGIITRLIYNIIDASEFHDASVYMRTELLLSAEEAANIDCFYRGSCLDWHLDKTLREFVYPEGIPSAPQPVYIFTLKGNATIYYPSNQALYDKFISRAINKELNYGLDLITPFQHDGLFDLSYATSPNYGQGAVHLAGKQHGAIHTAPHPHERLIVIVIPETKTIIDDYYQAVMDMNQKLLGDTIGIV